MSVLWARTHRLSSPFPPPVSSYCAPYAIHNRSGSHCLDFVLTRTYPFLTPRELLHPPLWTLVANDSLQNMLWSTESHSPSELAFRFVSIEVTPLHSQHLTPRHTEHCHIFNLPLSSKLDHSISSPIFPHFFPSDIPSCFFLQSFKSLLYLVIPISLQISCPSHNFPRIERLTLCQSELRCARLPYSPDFTKSSRGPDLFSRDR